MKFVLIILIGIIVFLTLAKLNISFSQEGILNNEKDENHISLVSNVSRTDITRPLVKITSPAYPPTINTDKILLKGIAIDLESGIKNVSALAHTFPFNGKFPVKLISQPIPIAENNWSHWSLPLQINDTGAYRIVITARDNSGNLNYAEITINAVIREHKKDNYFVLTNQPKPLIAFVRPTFTEAAYQENGFYNFYFKYGFPPIGKNITNDLDMLTVKTPKSVPEYQKNDFRYLSNTTTLVPVNGTELRDISQDHFPYPQKFWIPFLNIIKQNVPDSFTTIMRDEDVHDGHIFNHGNNKSNVFDILILFHNEYVTQAEYDNLRQFVSNGGTIIFIDANALYAEVNYDRTNHSVTLVKGHDWKFDGKAASRSVPERWYNETKDWVGSNFFINDIKSNLTFSNNPFNYTHFEEQFVNNPEAKILMDYGIKFSKDFVDAYLKKESLPSELKREDIPIEDLRVASYSMNFGKGKVIVLGLSGRLLADNQNFMNFFGNVILPDGLCPKFQSCWFPPTMHYEYGCTVYGFRGIHCDPVANEFESYNVPANISKIASITRKPTYVEAKFGNGVQFTNHSHESLRANIINAYNVNQFTVYLSFKPDTVPGKVSLMSYKNGIYYTSYHNAGWDLELIPNNNSSLKTIRFSVFNTTGVPTYSESKDLPIGRFSEIVGSFDGKSIKLYIDGNLKSETHFNGNYSGEVDNSNLLKIGGEPYCFCFDLNDNSVFDEIRYYDYSLNKEQVKLINNALHDETSEGLIGRWKFDGNLKDSSKFKNDLFYNTPVASMTFAPDGRLFFTEKNSGNIRVMENDSILEKPFASIPNVHVNWEQGLLGITVDSKFTENHFVYVYYNYKDEDTGNIYARILRFTEVGNKGIEPTIILDKIPASQIGMHTGGALAFNQQDDKLYVTVGDSRDSLSAENLSSLNGKTLRINRDGSTPNDNPFPDSPVYTYGHRNMYGIAFDEKGHGIVTEAGEDLYDEINSLQKGKNYGWPSMQAANTVPNFSTNDSTVKPMRSYFFTKTPTQASYYGDDKFQELKGKFIIGFFDGDLLGYKLSPDGKKLMEEILMEISHYPSNNVVATAVSPSGDIYFGGYDIFRLEKLDMPSKKQMTYAIQINSTQGIVSNVSYSEHKQDLTIVLTQRHGTSDVSIKIPKTFIDISGDLQQNVVYPSNETNGSLINFGLKTRSGEDYDIIETRFNGNAPETLKIVVNGSSVYSTPLD